MAILQLKTPVAVVETCVVDVLDPLMQVADVVLQEHPVNAPQLVWVNIPQAEVTALAGVPLHNSWVLSQEQPLTPGQEL